MRKYLVGFIAGLLLASAFPAYGAVTSMIGKQVQAENSVVVNGVELDVKAVNIDGTTYTPNRALAEALGAEIGFEDKKVIFDIKEGEPVTDVEQSTTTGNETGSEDILKELTDINQQITDTTKENNLYLEKIAILSAEYNTSTDRKSEIKSEMEEFNEKIKSNNDKLEQLESRRNELQSQLQSQIP